MLDHHRARGHRAGSGPSQGYSRMLLVLLFLALKATRGSACGEGSVGVTPHWRPAERAEGVYCSALALAESDAGRRCPRSSC